jgi:hypothetical protein
VRHARDQCEAGTAKTTIKTAAITINTTIATAALMGQVLHFARL